MTFTCRYCEQPFEPAAWRIKYRSFVCPPCYRAYGKQYRADRKADGNPVVSGDMPPEWHRQYNETYKTKPDVKSRNAARAKQRRNNPAERHKHVARWKLNRELVAGRIARQPCQVCGESKVDAHHDDYSRPLEVRWLCRRHHVALHAEAKATNS